MIFLVGTRSEIFFLKISPIKVLRSKFQKQLSKPFEILFLAFFSRCYVYGQILNFRDFSHIPFFGNNIRKKIKAVHTKFSKLLNDAHFQVHTKFWVRKKIFGTNFDSEMRFFSKKRKIDFKWVKKLFQNILLWQTHVRCKMQRRTLSPFRFQDREISPGKIKKKLKIENQIEKKHDPAN